MPIRLKVFAIIAALAAGTSSAAMAQYACPPGYAFNAGVCQPVPSPAYPSGPLSGAAAGEAAGAANGAAAAGPVGAIVGGAIGTVGGTANAIAGVSPAPACATGYTYCNGGCYPGRYSASGLCVVGRMSAALVRQWVGINSAEYAAHIPLRPLSR